MITSLFVMSVITHQKLSMQMNWLLTFIWNQLEQLSLFLLTFMLQEQVKILAKLLDKTTGELDYVNKPRIFFGVFVWLD